MSLQIEAGCKCEKCNDDFGGNYDITVVNGLIVCSECKDPITSDLELM